jgi:predicted nuclease of predicted toxin-antitoxin system
MRIKIDENLPVRLADVLRAEGHDVDTVLDEALGGEPDARVWAEAQAEKRFLITQDLDFSDSRRFVPGTHCGVLIARLPDSEQWRAVEHVARWMREGDASAWGGCVVVATPSRLRVKRPS